jgi:hypothetical protein
MEQFQLASMKTYQPKLDVFLLGVSEGNNQKHDTYLAVN